MLIRDTTLEDAAAVAKPVEAVTRERRGFVREGRKTGVRKPGGSTDDILLHAAFRK